MEVGRERTWRVSCFLIFAGGRSPLRARASLNRVLFSVFLCCVLFFGPSFGLQHGDEEKNQPGVEEQEPSGGV